MKKLAKCPKCSKTTPTSLGSEVPANPNAKPPIPKRLMLTCSVCGVPFYLVLK